MAYPLCFCHAWAMFLFLSWAMFPFLSWAMFLSCISSVSSCDTRCVSAGTAGYPLPYLPVPYPGGIHQPLPVNAQTNEGRYLWPPPMAFHQPGHRWVTLVIVVLNNVKKTGRGHGWLWATLWLCHGCHSNWLPHCWEVTWLPRKMVTTEVLSLPVEDTLYNCQEKGPNWTIEVCHWRLSWYCY